MCEITGVINVFAESCAINYTVWMSYLVLKKVNNPTSNFKVFHILAHVLTLLTSIALVLTI